MNRYRLESSLRNVGIAYLLFFFAGAHYAYMNRWGTQIVFWLTFGGFGIWWLIDMFTIPRMIDDYNDPIYDDLDWLDEQEWEREEMLDLRRRETLKRREEILYEYR